MTPWDDPNPAHLRSGWQTHSRFGWVRHDLTIPNWPAIKIAVLSDLHPVEPFTPLSFIRECVDWVQGIGADVILLPGDFISPDRAWWRAVPVQDTLAILPDLTAPLGVFAVLGNHDWKNDPLAETNNYRDTSVAHHLEASPIALLGNRATLLNNGLWLAGIDCQKVLRSDITGKHDPDAAFAGIPPGAPTLLMAHEPDYFATGDARAQLQISGHCHGGQMNLFGWRPLVPSDYGQRYAYGHITEAGRHLVVSGGLGFSGLPLRINTPTEVTLITVNRSA